jgi:hypothetical protein
MTNKHFSLQVALAGLMIPLAVIAAGIFPDVGDDHPYKGAIESLARSGIIKGNPDGKFYPERSVNRAEFLKLLYIATNRQPKPINVACFTDVERGSWYESYVCDAASKENGFVQGYSDGKFRPASPVNRTEALKMIFTVFGLQTPDISASDQDLIKFVDISVTAWYSKYISAAYKNGILPIPGHSGARFYPDKELLRGEAAAYMFNALNIRSEENTSSSTSSMASSMGRSASSYSSESFALKNVSFPFSDSDKFVAKKPVSYLFTLTSSRTVASINVNVTGYYPSDVTCRLYLMNDQGFTSEYYLGVQSGDSCYINASLRAGNYQLQIQPTVADVPYSVNASVGATDGNDGFMDAIKLTRDLPKTATLDIGDLADWYTFSVTSNMTAKVDVTSADSVKCVIYTPLTVDQFGFSGPECGKAYDFVAGETYVIGISRPSDSEMAKKIIYTVNWR